MKQAITAVMFSGILLLSAAVAAQRPQTAETELQAAIRTETIDGDLDGAIKQYKQIVARHATDRGLVAQALVRMAGCYEKLGASEARGIYEQVVRDYPDQQGQVAIARARLGESGQTIRAGEPVLRRVWQGSSSATPLPDGRFVSYDADQNIVLVDPASGAERVVTQKKAGSSDHTAGWITSKDGTQLVYTWYTDEKGRYDLRQVSLTGSGVPTPRVVYDRADANVAFPHDWSSDGRWIAIDVERKDRTRQLSLLSVSDTSVRVLKSSGWRGDGTIFFSPAGRYIAFDLESNEQNETRDVFLLALDGSRQVPAVSHPADDRLMGWSSDGKLLLFSSNRKGTIDLWAQPIDDGRPVGPPRLLHPDIGSKTAIGTTPRGTLNLAVDSRDFDIMVASFDPATGRTISEPVRIAPRFIGTNVAPDWSKDGRYLAYASRRSSVDGGTAIVIQDANTNQVVRELRPKLGYPNWLRWSPDAAMLLVSASDAKGRIGVMRVDARTGDATTIAAPRDDFWRGFRPEWSPDGKRIYFHVPGGPGRMVIERDLVTGAERQILRSEGGQDSIVLSPDGRSIVGRSPDGLAILLHPVDGGAPRELLRASGNQRFANVLQWTPDGRGLIVRKLVAGSPDESGFFVVPVSGGSDVKLQLRVPGARVHPDGRRIAFTVQEVRRETWVLENFLPSIPAAGAARR